MHQVQIAGHHEVAHELAEFDHPYWPSGDVGATAHEIEQAQAQEAGKTFVDDFERRHAPAHDALLSRQVVRAKACRRTTALL